MKNLVFDKTAKGRTEIATRACQLPLRLRTLLLLINGKHCAAEVLDNVSGLGLHEQSLQELLDQGFIQALPHDLYVKTEAPQALPPAVTSTVGEDDGVLREDQNQFQAIYRFYTETIRSTLGLRGYMLQLKVEKAATVEDFLTLRELYLDAVRKLKGKELARSLRDRLDQLLDLDETAAHTKVANTHQASSV